MLGTHKLVIPRPTHQTNWQYAKKEQGETAIRSYKDVIQWGPSIHEIYLNRSGMDWNQVFVPICPKKMIKDRQIQDIIF